MKKITALILALALLAALGAVAFADDAAEQKPLPFPGSASAQPAPAATETFNLSAFENNSKYTVTKSGEDTVIALNALSLATMTENDEGGLELAPEIVSSNGGPFVFRLNGRYTGNNVGAQKFFVLTREHRYGFTPTVSTEKTGDSKVETLTVNLAAEETLAMVKELAAVTDDGIQFSVLGSARSLSGWIYVIDKDAFLGVYDDYIAANGLKQDLRAASMTNACEILEIVSAPDGDNRAGALYASPMSGRFYNQYNSIRLFAGNGDKIHYEVYRGAQTISTGEVDSGSQVWLEGVFGSTVDVFLRAYVVGKPENAIYCSYTIDCSPVYNEYYESHPTISANTKPSMFQDSDDGNVTWSSYGPYLPG